MANEGLLPAGWPAMSLEAAHARLTGAGSPFETETATVDGVPMTIWKNGPRTLRELFVASRVHGGRTFIVYEGERVTYDAFARASLAFAHHLIDRGVRKGDRVALVMRNLPEWPVVYFGSVLAGAVSTPLNAWWTGDELEFALADSGAVVAVLDGERHARVGDRIGKCPALRDVIVTRAGSLPEGCVQLGSIIGATASWADLAERELPDVAIAPEDPASILYTSGTTGKPKGALQSHRNSTCNVTVTPFAAARNFLRRGEPIPAPDPNFQRGTLLSVPFFHTTGCHAIMCPTIAGGGKLALLHRWDAERAMSLIQSERLTGCGGVPTMAWQIVEHPRRADYDLSSLESVSYGGAPAASELVRRIKSVFPKSAPGFGWGMTETTGAVATHTGEDYVNRPESAGPPTPINELAIVDDSWNRLASGTIGELIVRGPNVIAGYWNRPEANATLFREGWFRTGDLAWIDEEGYLFLVDRKKDMLIRGGENIYCIEVEDVLQAHAAVMDAAVVGLPHRTLGEEPAAVVSLKPGQQVSEADLRAFVADRLAAFKVPVRILFQSEPLPRNANGKIMKPELKKMFGIAQ
jgi:long-chain acyl-CoA synthetase